MPDVDYSKSRMVFTAEQIKTTSLSDVKEESKSSIRKDIEYLIDDVFNNNDSIDEFFATPKDIKDQWFLRNSNISISYISKILKEEMKLIPENMMRYNKFGENDIAKISGKPYKFIRKTQRVQIESIDNIDYTPPF